MYKAEMRNHPGIVVVLSLVVMGCSQSVKQPSATKAPVTPTAAATKPPDASEEDRSQLVANLDKAIASLKVDLDKLIRMEVELDEIVESAPATTSIEQAAKLVDASEKGKAAQKKLGKELVEYQVMRDLVVLSDERSKKLANAIIDRCREKHFPMYERSYVAEKIGNRADERAAQLALEVSNKVVHGWGEQYEAEWMVNDAFAYRAARIDEIAESLASQISGGR